MAGSTPNYGWYLPGGGSTGTYTPDETADIDKINQDFIEIDADLFAVSQRVTEAEKYFIPTAPGATTGVIPAGTTAQRDLYWGAPANAAARVALAGRGARWFNTELGWEERYYSAIADASAVIPLSAKVAGWWPTGAEAPAQVLKGKSISNVPVSATTYFFVDRASYFDEASVRGSFPAPAASFLFKAALAGRYRVSVNIFMGVANASTIHALKTGITADASTLAFARTNVGIVGNTGGLTLSSEVDLPADGQVSLANWFSIAASLVEIATWSASIRWVGPTLV